MSTDNIYSIISNGVATIGGKYIIPKGIGTVSWSWSYDEVKYHIKKWNNVLYFIESPVNILSATVLSKSMKDDEGSWVLTKINIPFLLRILGGTKIQYLTQNIIF